MKKFIASALVLVAMAASLAAAETIAYLNMEKVFNEYYKTINENITFANNHKSFVAGLDVLSSEYQGSLAEYQKCCNDAENELLSADARAAANSKKAMLEGRLGQKQQEIIDYRDNGMQELEAVQQKVTTSLINDLTVQIRNFAKQKGYTTVLEVSGKTMSHMPAVLLYPEEKEITDAVIAAINAGHEKEQVAAKARLQKLQKQAEDEAKAKLEAARAAAAKAASQGK